MTVKTNGKWLNVSEIRFFRSLDVIVFEDDKIKYSLLERTAESLILVENNENNLFQHFSQCTFEFVNPNRIRWFRKANGSRINMPGKESSSYETVLEQDYVKLLPTISKISESRIQLIKYNLVWNYQKQVIEFNKLLDLPLTTGINEAMDKEAMKYLVDKAKKLDEEFNLEGMKILLEKLDQTLFVSFYNNNRRGLILPIKEIDEEKVVLYGFPKESFEIMADRIV